MNIPFEKSFASHEKSKYWSSKNTENPINIFKSSGKKYWFNCLCGHIFCSTPNHITSKNPTWCPYCSNPPLKLCENIHCILCYNNSFASNDKSECLIEDENKNKINPRNIFKSGKIKCLFKCDKCSHLFISSINNVSRDKWCPYCSHKKLCENNDCKLCFEKSFAYSKRCKYIIGDENGNKINPRNIFISSKIKCLFKCDKCCLEFKMTLNDATKYWCPHCVNKTEKKLYEKIILIYSSLIRQLKKEWCINELSKTNKYLPFDFCIPEYKIIIELDGPQHFRQIMDWKSPEEQHMTDKFKEECANNNGYSVIRLLQEDVMNDTYDWVKELYDAIEQIKSSNEITNVYLSKNNEYDNF